MAEIRIHKYEDGGWLEEHYEGEQLHGSWTVYFPDGSKSWERHYVQGVKEGFDRRWNQAGQLIEEEGYHLGERHGVWRRWDEQGKEEVLCEFYNAFRRDLVEASTNPEFCQLLKPFLAHEPDDFIPLLPELKQRWRKPTVLMKKGKRAGSNRTLRCSYWNWINVGRVSEEWPRFEGKPLRPMCQIRCDEIPLADHPLAEFSYVTLYAIADDVPCCEGEDIVVRAYRHGEELVPVTPPINPRESPAIMNLTEVVDSYPSGNDLPAGLRVLLDRHGDEHGLLKPGSYFSARIGGWPGWLQWGNLLNYGTFAFQVHAGVLGYHYFFRGNTSNQFDWRVEIT